MRGLATRRIDYLQRPRYTHRGVWYATTNICLNTELRLKASFRVCVPGTITEPNTVMAQGAKPRGSTSFFSGFALQVILSRPSSNIPMQVLLLAPPFDLRGSCLFLLSGVTCCPGGWVGRCEGRRQFAGNSKTELPSSKQSSWF